MPNGFGAASSLGSMELAPESQDILIAADCWQKLPTSQKRDIGASERTPSPRRAGNRGVKQKQFCTDSYTPASSHPRPAGTLFINPSFLHCRNTFMELPELTWPRSRRVAQDDPHCIPDCGPGTTRATHAGVYRFAVARRGGSPSEADTRRGEMSFRSASVAGKFTSSPRFPRHAFRFRAGLSRIRSAIWPHGFSWLMGRNGTVFVNWQQKHRSQSTGAVRAEAGNTVRSPRFAPVAADPLGLGRQSHADSSQSVAIANGPRLRVGNLHDPEARSATDCRGCIAVPEVVLGKAFAP